MPLTHTTVQNAKASPKAVKLFDGRGLYLEVAPTGGKLWRLKYRFGGKEKRLAFGVYPGVSLKDARQKRDEARSLLAKGVDPAEARKAIKASSGERNANSFEVISREWLSKYGPTFAPSHLARVERLFERDLFPWLGSHPVAEITPPSLLATLRRIETR